uniref:Uncharacterized protein n=1 Tax=viral metagenome TaxID=1070528 RepID=A0A6M3J7F7_9ZZZZ
MTYGQSPYKIRSTNPNDLVSECERVFALLSDRLDKMEGFRGKPQLYNILLTNFDVVCMNSSRGIILKDDQNPPNYHRITMTGASLTATNIGRNYE